MVRDDPQHSAMRAFVAIGALLQKLSKEGDLAQLEEVLDRVDALPHLVLAPEDRTEDFHEQLAGLREQFPALELPPPVR